VVSQYKKQKKARIPFLQSQWDFLLSLLGVIMMKMKYDEDTEWSDESDEPEEEALFLEMRKVGVLTFILIFFYHERSPNTDLFPSLSRTSRYSLTPSPPSMKSSMLGTSDPWSSAP
jgi:hypothetical protein